jgi:hypothetical protein
MRVSGDFLFFTQGQTSPRKSERGTAFLAVNFRGKTPVAPDRTARQPPFEPDKKTVLWLWENNRVLSANGLLRPAISKHISVIRVMHLFHVDLQKIGAAKINSPFTIGPEPMIPAVAISLAISSHRSFR